MDTDWGLCQPSMFTALQKEVTALRAERDRRPAAFSSFVPSSLSMVQTLMERARGVDATSLSVDLKNLKVSLPLVRRILSQAQDLRDFIKINKRSQLVTKQCSTLAGSLARMHSAYHTSLISLTGLPFHPGDAMQRLRFASTLLSDLSAVKLVPLPQDTTHLTLAETRKYIQAEEFNQAVRELISSIGSVIDSQASIEECMEGLSDLETPDIEALTALNQESGALLDALYRLSRDQTVARTLVQQWKKVPLVTKVQAEREEFEVDCLGDRLKRLKGMTGMGQERAAVQAEIATRKQTLASMQRSIQERARLTRRLAPYTHLPEVAKALGQPLTPLDSALKNQAVMGVGMMVKHPVC
ncbi:hypothetical protein KIPB_002604 [Kipferlia bialata]|uniref:Uncharacterized protein n=1 Tax=Kipferlia bialata TaxID=797122 RepID=A0A9K3CU42_9EUKA|nr:hypothetical protein KIPB_002604 [Kipferlia bialata]|eukprot:g2604.t1